MKDEARRRIEFAKNLCAVCLAHRLEMTPRAAMQSYLDGWEPTEQWLALADNLHEQIMEILPEEAVQ